ncbi:unnamed protein product [Blepharisma stoltei]|uniref:GOLD domain-containing protein n=1 Tax=Blepharisma stoltei TaxID=1481888 RepID=A0AAU9J6G9_9CILI|nr:unnamed protein product [Blepharisma stoltei]
MLIFISLFLGVNSFEFSIRKQTIRCFSEELTKGTLFWYETQVLQKSGTIWTRFSYKDVDQIHEAPSTHYDNLNYTAANDGTYHLCIENQSPSEISVSLDIRIGIDAKKPSDPLSVKSLDVSKVQLQIVQEYIKQLHNELQYIREREEEMRNTNETIYSRVIYYTAFTIVMLILISILQIVYFQKYLKSKKLI